MRDITIGESTYGVSATTLALLFYKQEFKSDLIKDYSKLSIDNLDTVIVLQIFWAMNKAHKLPEKQSSFENWCGSLDGIDYGDPDLFKGILLEAAEGLFPKSASKVGGAKKPARKR